MSKPAILLVTGLSLFAGGCFSGKKTTPVVLVPSTPAPAVVPVTVAPDPPALPAPAVVTNPQTLPGSPAAPAQPKPIQAAKPVKRKKAAKPAAAPAPAPAPETAAAAPIVPAPQLPPQLQEILPADRRKQYEAEYSQGMARANQALKQVSKRTLDASHQEMAARVRTFLTQAQAARGKDLSTALQLARRADLLGQELLKSLR
jgi:hypothetical protein